MVKLTKIYTRTGDSGTTGLGGGQRVPKAHARVEAYGGVDEANSSLGLAICSLADDSPMRKVLITIQHDMFDLGADLCTPIAADEEPGKALRILQSQIDRLEDEIDRWNKDLGPLTSFVLPGGSELASRLHVARTVCRRAERQVCVILELEPEATSGLTLTYLNRLSDLLFVLARAANDGGKADVLWIPGHSR